MRQIGQDLWVFEKPFRLFGADFGNRMTVVRMADGSLFVHSPVEFDPGLAGALAELGHVRWIVTPNCFHGLYIDDWLAAFPSAQYFAPAGVKASTVAVATPLDDSASLWSADVAQLRVGGIPKLNEYVFFHRPSKSLILTDLAFNIGPDVSLWTKIFFTLNDAYGKFGPSRLMRSMVEDPAALAISLREMLVLDFENIVVSHGCVVAEDAKRIFRASFERYLGDAAEPGNKARFQSPIRCG